MDNKSTNLNKAEQAVVQRMMEEGTTCLSGGDFIDNWDKWRETVNTAIQTARRVGMPDRAIEIASVKVGDYLSKKLCVKSKEEALIKELWDTATPDERKVLGKLLFKIMDKGPASSV